MLVRVLGVYACVFLRVCLRACMHVCVCVHVCLCVCVFVSHKGFDIYLQLCNMNATFPHFVVPQTDVDVLVEHSLR